MMKLRGSRVVTKRKPHSPLRFEVAPGIVVAHDARTVLILEATSSSQVRVRDVATGSEQTVSVSELSGIAGGLSRRDILHRWEQVRSTTRDEWLRARRREGVIRRLIRGDGAVAAKVAGACRALGLSRPTIYRLLQRYRQAAQTSSLLVGHRGTPQQHRDQPFLQRPSSASANAPEAVVVNYELPTQELESELLGPRR